MSISIEICPTSDSLDMYGEPDSSSAYSLSGHVAISVTSPFSLFERRRTARLLLQSVVLTFEGQSETITPQTGYSSLRLCSITQELAPCGSIELNNEGHEDSAEPCVWNVIFNLPIPGWLPASTVYGVEETGVRYGLFAEAKFINLDNNQSGTWSFATLCSPFRSRTRSVNAQKLISLRRLLCPVDEDLDSSTLTYLVNSSAPPQATDGKPHIPPEVLSKIQVLASVPNHVDVDGGHIPLTVRMRTKDLELAECQRIQVSSISADIIQREKCRARPSPEYLTRYPVPPRSRQPPNEPLRDAHPFGTAYDVGLYVFNATQDAVSRSFSLLPPGEPGRHSLGENNYPFTQDTEFSESPTWYTLETTVPFVSCAAEDKSKDWAGPSVLRPSSFSPLLSVQHEVSIELTCVYDIPRSDAKAKERLSFSVPIRFAHFAPLPERNLTPPPPHFPISLSIPAETPAAPSLPVSGLYAQSLPAYSQLFDHNGDRKIDYSVPLPLYTPRSPPSSSSSPSLIELNMEGKESDLHPPPVASLS